MDAASNGALTKKISDMGADVIGMDASGEMLEIARKNYPELTFIQDDAVKFILNEQVDVIFSNAVFHWIDNQDGLLESVYNGLKINGSLVCEFGGYGCTETIHSFLQKAFEARGVEYKRTFYFPTIDEYTPILRKHGPRTPGSSGRSPPTPSRCAARSSSPRPSSTTRTPHSSSSASTGPRRRATRSPRTACSGSSRHGCCAVTAG
ncbi:class I SAM-dependent methyltransferase [Bradyrhizobium sp. WBAH41]|uniref:class I SAM-dependent methyltransferase n=1 Tax=Bradyrhizobium sp. WBAH41 TaxID=1390131 RepID=UPI00223FC137|nr:class I SAM-dependent methyltransferase [Bradyrhizobium sp. WBAH41]